MSLNENTRVVIASPHVRHDNLELALQEKLGFNVLRIRDRSDLEISRLLEFMPRYIFFPHWSWIIPEKIFKKFECVVFHMTDLPYGRGGSPLQNLIVRGISETQLTALRCVAAVDAGPIYIKRPLSLSGTAEDILLRAANLTEEMIEYIVREQPKPTAQIGEVTVFRRRLPEEGSLADLDDLEKIFDYIRMLDADGYPNAFIETAAFRFSFSRASLSSEAVVAEVKITRRSS
jgi:methionyl-tRNA formyltransferase